MGMFICEVCKKKQATVHLTDIHNGEKKELHICQECAEAQGISFQHNFSLQDLLSGLAKREKQGASPDLRCQVCGLTWSQFQSRGRLGCAHDYTAFREELLPMIRRIHGNVQHVGKSPGLADGSGRQEELTSLQRQMREAIDREAYEDAAALRDRIGRLKRAAGSGDDA